MYFLEMKAPAGVGWGGRSIYNKGVTVRFGFDGRRISQIQRQIKNKATGTPYEVYHVHPSCVGRHLCARWHVWAIYTYIHWRGAFSVVHSKMIFLICYLLDYQ